MEEIKPGTHELIELDMWDERFGDLQREFNRDEESKERDFRKFVEDTLPLMEHGEYGAAEATFKDYHNAEVFSEMAKEQGFSPMILESGRQEKKPYVKVRNERASFNEFLASRGYKKKTE